MLLHPKNYTFATLCLSIRYNTAPISPSTNGKIEQFPTKEATVPTAFTVGRKKPLLQKKTCPSPYSDGNEQV